ncbi:DUF2505 domain-containing protein [Isoptericola variabilis]|uniref:Polyketide cyclase/dehydrase n=1 Tax=Isoptericola variabilis (strain 225) TaxID=743718 RepID=F6FS53_ISOV2|nr:DUF2505 domain-containing protein [Isoptericola variabilis]AEG45150.1 Protein of unknown function DUF2505 [Isoptericola variabilis 225]TWH31442.1 uncharacterized protein DUF2505 [Isoptericola variabilis J7]
MHLTVELTYPADVDAVAAMLADESSVRWRTARSTTGGTLEAADVTGSLDSGFTVAVRRTMPVDTITGHVRHLVGDQVEVRQVEAYEPPSGGRMVGTVAIEIVGAPVRITGTVRVEPLPDGGTRHVYDGDVHATVPLFANAVAEAAAAAARRTLEADADAARAWLAEHAG